MQNTLIVVDRYLFNTGIKLFQTRQSLVWHSFLPFWSRVSIYDIQV